MAANTGKKQRGPGRKFKPGESGNPAGRKPGTKARATMLAEKLLDGEAEELVRTVIEMAKAGDMDALKVCISRIIPPRTSRPVKVKLPSEMKTTGDMIQILTALFAAVCKGEVTPGEAEQLAKLVEVHRKTLELEDLEKRLADLERRAEEGRGAR